jgi:hypothetical protein
MSYDSYNWFVFWLFIVLALVLFYQAWMNLVRKQLTKFSIDAILLLYLRVKNGKAASSKAKNLLRKEPKRMQKLGFIAIASALAAIYIASNWYLKYLVS